MRVGTLLHRVTERAEGFSGLDSFAGRIAPLADRAIRSTGIKDALSGTWLGHPLHPLATDAVIGSWALAALLDRHGEDNAAKTLVGLGVLAAVPTAASGASDWVDTPDIRGRRLGLIHAASNVVALLLNTTSYVARRAGRHDVGARLTVGSALPLTVGGFLGAHMAYARGIGVSRTAFDERLNTWTPLTAPTVRGQWASATVDGLSVLVRLDEGIAKVVSANCTHCGASLLPDPQLSDRLRCPTDGSVFADDGAILKGPATTPIPHFDARSVTNGIEVRTPS